MAAAHRSDDWRGVSKLTVDAVIAISDIAEMLHMTILRSSGRWVFGIDKPIGGITSLAYRSVRSVARLTGGSLDTALFKLAPLLVDTSRWPGRPALLAAINGVLGDYLAESGNPLAIPMTVRHQGTELTLAPQALADTVPDAGSRLLVMVHGLCMNDRQWLRRGHDHGAELAKVLGYTPLYLHYNSGLHISHNGQSLDQMLEDLVAIWPVKVTSLTLIGHSMGGLVARSACHYASLSGHHWRSLLDKLICLGTPHHGAPLERSGNWFHLLMDSNRYTAPFARLGKLRSAGITDLRHGSLLDEDWQSHDRFAHAGDQRQPVPLPAGVACYAAAAAVGDTTAKLGSQLAGDGLVPLDSALGQHSDPERSLNFPAEHCWIGYRMNHLDLLNRPEVYAQLKTWLQAGT
ncbi:alpha/beta hydrolase [Chitinivorax sp. B]|uniref:esterase/lipase family protein n=1 Tax=Chitinivorax sp. B TaxID=2502235 RepID=UPI0010F837FB|nr:alpha/beta hydrolase [Chitinivorax sp. B]